MTVTSVLSNFLLWASAAPRHLVDQFPSERAKALGIGGAIMTTSGMAAASATFALHEVLHIPGRPALLGGITWGAAVFNLDRWLVAAIRRRPTFLGNLAAFAPRFILAAVIGTVIAEPLVLRAFAPEIETELSLMQTEAAAEQTRTLAEDPRYVSIPEMKTRAIELQAVVDGASDFSSILENPEVIDLTSRLDAKAAELAVAERAVICEHEGTCGSNIVGAGPAWREKVDLRDRLRTEEIALLGQLETKKTEISDRVASTARARRESAESDLSSLQTELDALTSSRDAEAARFESANVDGDGLLARMEALSRLSDRSRSLAAAEWVLRLAIIFIDTLPVLIKFLIALGPQPAMERALLREEDDADQLHAAELSDRHEHIRLVADTSLVEARSQAALEDLLAQRVSQKIVDAEERVYDVIIDAWEQRQLADVQADIDSYIS